MKWVSERIHVMIILMILVVVAGCAASRDINRIAQTSGDFSFDRIVRQGLGSECASMDAADANLIDEYDPDRCIVSAYTRGNAAYQVNVLEFFSHDGAIGAFTVRKPDNAEKISIGSTARRYGGAVQFVKGNFLVTVTPQRNGTAEGVTGLARQISSGIMIGVDLGPFNTLITENLVEDSPLYFMGPLGLETRYPRNLVEVLMVNRDVEGVAARYRINGSVADFIEITYPDYMHAREAQDSYLRSFSGGPLVFPDEMLRYYTIVMPERSEVYIAQYDNRVYLMFGNPFGGQNRPFFEYILRSANQTVPNT